MQAASPPRNTQWIAFALITSLFFMWGLANNMTDTLLAAFKKIMSMSDFQTSWIQIAFYGSYFCLALPAALIIKKFSYKSGILIGLGMAIGGSLLFYPASITMAYGHFLAALFIFAGGLAILETTANPYIYELGPAESAVQRLNLAQSFNPIGSIMGVILSKYFILANLNQAGAEERSLMSAAALESIQREELNAVMGPYIAVALILLVIWLLIYFRKMPFGIDTDTRFDLGAAVGRLLKRKQYTMGVVAQFFYVGAQIGVWSYTIRYVMVERAVDEASAANYYLMALVLFMGFRFVCTWLMRYFSPKSLLSTFAFLSVLLTLVVIYAGGMLGVVALVSISACMSLMYPTIYGLSIRGLGADTKLAGSGLVMAILGGAALTAIQGLIADAAGNVHTGYFVPLACFLVVGIYGLLAKPYEAETVLEA
jgi:FHS family L-fucose permease-like MFS transporter